MKHLILTTLTVISALAAISRVVEAARSDDAREEAVRKSSEIFADLYLTLRRIAFPNSPYSSTDTVHNRLILLSPGKALNYYDYYPGDQYSASLKAKNTSDPQALVPPSVMEKWFDIADVVVGGELNSGDTGKSLAQVYRNILSKMTVKDFKNLYQDAEARYSEAQAFLTEPIQNPVNLSEKTTRMQLYTIYQEEYAQQKLNLEDMINGARKNKSSLEYELWFQRNFQPLNSKVESAYSKWLVFGQKELVELHKTFMDVSSAGAALEEARISLRASGVLSLDRTRTIYPVSFEPSNWYEYLLVKDRPPSRDMLIAKRSLLQSELDTLRTAAGIIARNQQTAGKTTNALQKRIDATSENRNESTEAAVSARNRCMQKQANDEESTGSDDPCAQFQEEADKVEDATSQNAEATAEYFSAAFLFKSNQQYQTFMRLRTAALESQISEINTQLDNLQADQVYLGEITESISGFEEMGEQGFDQWMKFSYNSETTHMKTTEEKFGTSINVGISATIKAVSLGVSANAGFESAEMQREFSRANLQASGELLRVFIKRPWFKPSLFDNPTLNFVQYDSESKKTAYVSPPPSTEQELADSINGLYDNTYVMPEYVTNFLLSRNVKLQFSGLDYKAVSKTMRMMFSYSPSIGLVAMGLPFKLNWGFGFTKSKTTVTADRTENGMVIHIPGAQIIGYYTQVMPQFPKHQV